MTGHEGRLAQLEMADRHRAEVDWFKDIRTAVVEKQRAVIERMVASHAALEKQHLAAMAGLEAKHERDRLREQTLGEQALRKLATGLKLADLDRQLAQLTKSPTPFCPLRSSRQN